MSIPQQISLGNFPTPVFSLDHSSYKFDNSKIYLKRDDFAGFEMCGNKVRKLEFAMKQAIDQQADVIITCGGIQSNHARAVAAAAAMINKQTHLVLKKGQGQTDGNYFLDLLFHAKIKFITTEDYKCKRHEVMEELKEEYEKAGLKAYIIPEGASNGIGMFGYYRAYEEILRQERRMRVRFDTICCADGSSGTYAGLYAANQHYGGNKNIVGFNVYDVNKNTKLKIESIILEGSKLAGWSQPINMDQIAIIDEYVGEGDGMASDEVIEFIMRTAKNTGILFDPIYTGKAFMGLIEEIKKQNPLLKGNVLFIHTGGQFALFPYKNRFLHSRLLNEIGS